MQSESLTDIKENPNIIVNKKNLQIIKNKRNDYSILYRIENHNIYLPKILNFSIIKLICEVNKDVFEDFNIEFVNENEANVYILVKHYFKELSLPKRYSYLNTKISEIDNFIIFNLNTIYDKLPNIKNFPNDVSLLPMDRMIVNCDISDQHNVVFSNNVLFSDSFIIPDFVEKFSLILFSKMFLRTKQFIETIK
uniref:Uncharacterized protein n=1 Tax=viral metagenome TaxID=1070528 RepID=A0A6C0KXD0_9ZZZZ